MSTKVFFLAPTRDSPPDGPIALGNVIADPRSPEIALNDPDSPAIQDLKVYETEAVEASCDLSTKWSVGSSVWAKFVMDTVGGEVGITRAWTDGSAFSFERLVTRTIAPSLDTIRTVFNEPSIQESIKDRRWQGSLFMITGVQVAYGAQVVINKARGRGVHINVGVDLTPAGAPMSVGSGLQVSREPTQSLQETYSQPFVFSYRLRQLIYRRRKVEKQKDYRKGDLVGASRGSTRYAGPVEEEVEYAIELDALDEEDEELPEILGLDVENGTTADGKQFCIVSSNIESDDNLSDSK